jgi:DNA polymerase III epsilon subunit-like protein
MNLYIDTATSSWWQFPRGGKPADDSLQPHMVRLAWLLEALDGTTVREASHLIRLPQGERMAQEAAHYLGIYDHFLLQLGKAMFDVLTEFAEALGEAKVVVAHSWAFHRQVLERSFRFVGMPARPWPTNICTMIRSTDIVCIPKQQPGGGNKWPSMEETCDRFLGRRLMPSMDPVADGIEKVRAVRVFLSNIRRHQEGDA